MTSDQIVQIRPRLAVESVSSALVDAFAWAGDDEERLHTDVLMAFVDLVRACDAVQEEGQSRD